MMPIAHIGMVRSGEPACEYETNEHSNVVLPPINSLYHIYMDDLSFIDSIESGVPDHGSLDSSNTKLS
jgi:hypothetical protein